MTDDFRNSVQKAIIQFVFLSIHDQIKVITHSDPIPQTTNQIQIRGKTASISKSKEKSSNFDIAQFADDLLGENL